MNSKMSPGQVELPRHQFTISRAMMVIAIVAVLLWLTHSAFGATIMICLVAFYSRVYCVVSSGPSLPRNKTLRKPGDGDSRSQSVNG